MHHKKIRSRQGFTQHHFSTSGSHGSRLVSSSKSGARKLGLPSTTFSTKSGAGFTLLELLVVVAIIGFLSTISVVALTASQQSSRDKQRKLDQLTIIKAAELFTNDFGVAPAQFCIDELGDGCDLTSFNTTSESKFVQIDPKRISSPLRSLLSIPTAQALFLEGGGGGEVPPPVCGNGSEEVNEECDDGNTLNCDTCSSTCQVGSGNSCGDGVTRCSEACDDGNTSNCDACSASCQWGTGTICGDGTMLCTEACDDGNTTDGDGCSSSCQVEPPPDGGIPSCGNSICEPELGENVSNCTSDCIAGGEAPATCGNAVCDTLENPANCQQDCSNYSMCYVNTQWDLCCLFGDQYCTAGTSSIGGYYGVCNVDQCEQKYLLQQPAVTCGQDSDCRPQGLSPAHKFVADTNGNWLKGLENYLIKVPTDPGHHSDSAYDHYFASSNPDIVRGHRFCVWVSLERDGNFNPYNDLTETPTGALDTAWTPLCAQ